MEFLIILAVCVSFVWGAHRSYHDNLKASLERDQKELERYRQGDFTREIINEAASILAERQRADESKAAFEARVQAEIQARMRAMDEAQMSARQWQQPVRTQAQQQAAQAFATQQVKPQSPWQQAKKATKPTYADREEMNFQQDEPLDSSFHENAQEAASKMQPSEYHREQDFPTPAAM